MSTQRSDDIIAELGSKFILHCETRWNTEYSSVNNVRKKWKENPEALGRLLMRFSKSEGFSNEEIVFMHEYVKILGPIAWAVDELQGDQDKICKKSGKVLKDAVALGNVLPAIRVVKLKLNDFYADVQVCKPLLDSVLNGIKERFDHHFDEKMYKMAALTHPRFKLGWIDDDDQRESALALLESEFISMGGKNNTQLQPTKKSFKDPYALNPVTSPTNTETELQRFLNSSDPSVQSLKNFPIMEELFRKYNTSLPSSAR